MAPPKKEPLTTLAGTVHPLQKAGFLSILTFAWLNPFIHLTRKGTTFEQTMHAQLPNKDRTMQNFTLLWKARSRERNKGLFRSLCSVFGVSVLLIMSVVLFQVGMGTAIKYINLLLSRELERVYAFDKADRDWTGVMKLVASVVLLNITQTLIFNAAIFQQDRVSFRMQFALSGVVIDKVLKISLLNPSSHDEGSISNNLQIDCQRFGDCIPALFWMCLNLLNLFVSIGMGVWLFSWTFLVMIGVLVVNCFLMSGLVYFWFKNETNWMGAKDKRLAAWKYCFSSIRYFKIRAWETNIIGNLTKFRMRELKYQLYNTIIYSINILLLMSGPSIAVFVFLKVYFSYGNILEVSKIAVFITLIFELSEVLNALPSNFNFINEISVGLKRLNKLMDHEEIDLRHIKNREPFMNADNAIELTDGEFYWKIKPKEEIQEEDSEDSRDFADDEKRDEDRKKPKDNQSSFATNNTIKEFLIKDQTQDEPETSNFDLRVELLEVPAGKVTFVIGKIGSGKSSLLYALLGEMSIRDPSKTRLNIRGSVGYVSQKPWVINSTVKDNIILDLPPDAERLERAVRLSCLEEDVRAFERGLEQETGENGEALSGGQRTRLALARCIYQDPDIYVLDDVLSALDSNVGETVMEQTILRELRGKTVLMSTHAIQYLSQGHKIVLMEAGKIEAQGDFAEVSTCGIYQRYLEINAQFQQTLDQHKQESKTNEFAKQGTADLDTLLDSLPLLRPLSLRNSRASRKTRDSVVLLSEGVLEQEEVLKNLIIPEDREKGAVSCKTYATFFKELGGYLPNLFGFLVCLSIEAVMTANFARLSTWSEKFSELDQNKELNHYMLFSMSGAGLSFMRTMLYGCLSYFLSRKIHSKMIFGVLHSRMEEFLSRVPAGRIINRFSKDIQEIDQSLIYNVSYFFTVTAELLIYILTFGYLLGYEVVISIVCMMIICIYYQRIYMSARREFIRLDAISKSPILTTVIDTMRGLTNIRNSEKQSYFRKKFLDRCDESLKNTYIRNALNEWYSVRTGIITSLFVLVPSYLNIMYGSKNVSLATAVFTIVINSSLSYSLKEVLTQYSRLEASMIAVERCHHFEKIEPEPQYKSYKKDFALVDGSKSSIEKLKKRQIENTERIVTEGSIEFKDMSCKYATSQNPILSKLSFAIKPREKIGVIGRTGSGKSTLIKLLWRALDFYEGDIKIDGKSIKEVDLKSLRSQIMIVTQETALIEGTLRENIDIRLEDKSKDAEITEILTRLGFANPNYLKDGLDMAIDGEGSNLSAGEKQLISFARTLLDKKKIMILDEATANIDLKTEEKIQACVDQDFKDTTMLIIAHRIQTIMNCDRILILEKGKMAALDTPANLSNQKDSYFNNIINKMKEKKS